MWDSQTWTSKTTTIECEGDVEECKRVLKDLKIGDEKTKEESQQISRDYKQDFDELLKQRNDLRKVVEGLQQDLSQVRMDLKQTDTSFKNMQEVFRIQEKDIAKLMIENSLMKSLLSPWDKQ